MAKAKVKKISKKKYKLSLTEEEAITLHAVLMKVGGDVVNSPRKHVDEIRGALRSVGINAFLSDHLVTASQGSIMFNDGKVIRG